MKSRCTEDQDTVCHPCEQGFYNEAMNYEDCKPCTQCNQSERPPPPPAETTFIGRSGAPTAAETNPKPQRGLLRPGVPRDVSLLPGGQD